MSHIPGRASEESLRLVKDLISTSGHRTTIPVRNSFVRSADPTREPKLQRLVARRAGVAIKLYLAVIWRSSRAPFTTQYRARHWAELLGLDDPATNGARRIRDALKTLSDEGLVSIQAVPGTTPVVTLRREDGAGPYTVPSAVYREQEDKAANLYFQLPYDLWTSGHLQDMSAAALAMLLVISEESRGKAEPQWWSTEEFDKRFHIRKDVRADGTRELKRRDLIETESQYVGKNPGMRALTKDERTRKLYSLINEAKPKNKKEKATESDRAQKN